jgi:antitoxin Phd
MGIWKLEDAKKQFSRLVRQALARGPQVVTKHGEEQVVVMAVAEYRRLTRRAGFVEFMRKSPMAAALTSGELELLRADDQPRDREL